MTRLILLTGPRDMGKTTACLRFAQIAERARLCVGGILAPGTRGNDGLKSCIDVVDVASGQRERLATAAPKALGTIGRFRLDNHAVQWSLTIMLDALRRPFDAVIIDEIGPLELAHGDGYAKVLPRLAVAKARAVIVLVRESCLGALRRRLAGVPCRVLRLDAMNRDVIPRRLLRAVLQVPRSRRPRSTPQSHRHSLAASVPRHRRTSSHLSPAHHRRGAAMPPRARPGNRKATAQRG